MIIRCYRKSTTRYAKVNNHRHINRLTAKYLPRNIATYIPKNIDRYVPKNIATYIIKCAESILVLTMLVSLSACSKNTAHAMQSDANMDETRTETIEDTTESYTDDTEDELDLNSEPSTYSTEITMYIISLSASLKATAQYSLTEDGEIYLDTYAFDTSCEYYTANHELIDFNTFKSIIDDNTANNQRTKCTIEVNHKKIVSQVNILN